MKIKNIFSAKNKNTKSVKIEKIEKNQLEKVVGGTDTTKVVTVKNTIVDDLNGLIR